MFTVSWYQLYLAFLIFHASAGLLFCFIELIQLVFCYVSFLPDTVLSMKPCPKWSQSRTSSSTSLFCKSEEVTETAENVQLLQPRFQSACPVFSGRYPLQRIPLLQLFLKQSQSSNIILKHLHPFLTPISDMLVCEATTSCLL